MVGAVRARTEFGLALLLDLIGAAVALLVSALTWQKISVNQNGLASAVVHVSGRTLDSAPTALALVALAGVVALIATRGVWRRVVGAVLVVVGLGGAPAQVAVRALDVEDLVAGADDEQPPRAHASL